MKTIKPPRLKDVDVWTAAYTPFIMGGDVNAPILTTVPAAGPFDLGRGFKGYLVTAPSGKTFVAEATTGAFVGPTIESVKKDIAKCTDIMLMKMQVSEAAELKKKARRVAPERFWTGLKANRPVVHLLERPKVSSSHFDPNHKCSKCGEVSDTQLDARIVHASGIDPSAKYCHHCGQYPASLFVARATQGQKGT